VPLKRAERIKRQGDKRALQWCSRGGSLIF
jgi:hypothetical protein